MGDCPIGALSWKTYRVCCQTVRYPKRDRHLHLCISIARGYSGGLAEYSAQGQNESMSQITARLSNQMRIVLESSAVKRETRDLLERINRR